MPVAVGVKRSSSAELQLRVTDYEVRLKPDTGVRLKPDTTASG